MAFAGTQGAGAAIGTAVAPGIGTAVGALVDVGSMFLGGREHQHGLGSESRAQANAALTAKARSQTPAQNYEWLERFIDEHSKTEGGAVCTKRAGDRASCFARVELQEQFLGEQGVYVDVDRATGNIRRLDPLAPVGGSPYAPPVSSDPVTTASTVGAPQEALYGGPILAPAESSDSGDASPLLLLALAAAAYYVMKGGL